MNSQQIRPLCTCSKYRYAAIAQRLFSLIDFVAFGHRIDDPGIAADDTVVIDICIAAKNRRVGIYDYMVADVRMTFPPLTGLPFSSFSKLLAPMVTP